MGRFYTITLLCVSTLLLGPQKCSADDLSPIIEINSGKIQGVEKESRDDRDFYAFRGIPYASPPVGELRFEAPIPPNNWSDVKSVNEYEKPCIQYDPFEKKVIGSEDCLKLNVFTPKIGEGISKKQLPVMVFIHGGAGDFMTGSSNEYRPHYFMDEDVVVVTFNYRLASFGFLNTEDGLVKGNMGLKDQVMTLKWIQQNIRKFGGDPKKVTLFGSNSASVSLHMTSPVSKGLFKKAITQSGNSLKPFSLQTSPRQAAFRMAQSFVLPCQEVVNMSSSDPDKCLFKTSTLVQCLKKIDAKKLAEYHKEFYTTPPNPLAYFTPSIENAFHSVNDTAFLTEHPFSILSTGRQIKIPWMTGVNADEGLSVTARILNNKENTEQVETHWDSLAPKFLLYDKSRTDITKSIRKYYLSDPEPENINSNSNSTNSTFGSPANNSTNSTLSTTNTTIAPILSTAKPVAYDYVEDDGVFSFEEKFSSLTNMISDRYYNLPMITAVQIQKQYSPVWLYYYNYRGQYTMSDAFAGKSKADKPGLALRQLGRVTSWFKNKVLGRTEPAPKHLGVCTLDETILLFKYPELKIKENTKDYAMSKDLVKLWVNFADNENNLKFRNNTWSPVNQNSERILMMQFGNSENSTGMIEAPFLNRIRFWQSLPFLAPFQQN